MSVEGWLEMARADADKRGLAPWCRCSMGWRRRCRRCGMRPTDWTATTGRSPDRPREGAIGAAARARPGAGGRARSAQAGRAGSIAELAAQLARGTLTSERLVEDCLAQIAARQPELNAFITVTADEALAAARRGRSRVRGGPAPRAPARHSALAEGSGRPGRRPTTAGVAGAPRSHRAPSRRAGHGAAARGRRRVRRQDQPARVRVRHHQRRLRRSAPRSNPDRSDAIARWVERRLGDRRAPPAWRSPPSAPTPAAPSASPSAACGIVGLKPEWGEIPAAGVVPLSRQLDHVGPLARSVADAWLMYDVMRRRRPRCRRRSTRCRCKRPAPGRAAGYLFDRLDAEVEHGRPRAPSTACAAAARR